MQNKLKLKTESVNSLRKVYYMGKMPLKIFVLISTILISSFSVYAYEFENTMDNPRLVNLTPRQFHSLEIIEKRIYNNTFREENTMDRIERLELDLFNAIQKGTVTQRLNTLRIESTKSSIRGTAMTPMMMDNFNTKYINPRGEDSGEYHEDVGIIDGLIRVWWPDFYETISEYRRFKEANFY